MSSELLGGEELSSSSPVPPRGIVVTHDDDDDDGDENDFLTKLRRMIGRARLALGQSPDAAADATASVVKWDTS